MTPFNAPKAHAIDVHFQTLSFHLIAVAFSCFIAIDELAMTSDANVMSVYLALCHSSEYELTGTRDIALKLTSIHTSIMLALEGRGLYPILLVKPLIRLDAVGYLIFALHSVGQTVE